MLETFYQFFRAYGSEGIPSFAILSYTLFCVLGSRSVRLRAWQYVLFSTACFSVSYLVVEQSQLIPYISLAVGQTVPYWFYYLCTIFFAVLFAQLLLKGNLFQKLTYTLYYVSLVLLYKLLWMPLYQQESVLPHETYRFYDLLSAAILLMLLLLLSVLFRWVGIRMTLRRLPPRAVAMTLYFPVSFLLCYCLIFSNETLSEKYTYTALTLIILTILPVVYCLVASIISAYEEQRRLDAALRETEAKIEHYRSAAALEESLRRERHELKNHYFYLQTLLRSGKYAEAEAYLDQQNGQLTEGTGEISTGNSLLDYLLNRENAKARAKGSKLFAEILVPERLAVDEDALCSILSNLLDNAIEASEALKAPDIHIQIRCIPGYLLCQVKNRTAGSVLRENPTLRTTKRDAEAHGFGLKVVRSTVERCDGILKLEEADGYFVANVMLPLRGERETPKDKPDA